MRRWILPASNGGRRVSRLSMPTTPGTFRTARSTVSFWYCQSTSLSRVIHQTLDSHGVICRTGTFLQSDLDFLRRLRERF